MKHQTAINISNSDRDQCRAVYTKYTSHTYFTQSPRSPNFPVVRKQMLDAVRSDTRPGKIPHKEIIFHWK